MKQIYKHFRPSKNRILVSYKTLRAQQTSTDGLNRLRVIMCAVKRQLRRVCDGA